MLAHAFGVEKRKIMSCVMNSKIRNDEIAMIIPIWRSKAFMAESLTS